MIMMMVVVNPVMVILVMGPELFSPREFMMMTTTMLPLQILSLLLLPYQDHVQATAIHVGGRNFPKCVVVHCWF